MARPPAQPLDRGILPSLLGYALRRAQSAVFAANQTVIQNRTSFTNSMIQTLNTGADALTMADQNEESANLLALNTQQQLAQTALSLASQANAAITRLF